MKETMSRVSIPGRVLDLLWTDDEFFRDVATHKKATSAGKFPRCDQWCDEGGFHMAFALAGYSPSDVSVGFKNNELYIDGVGSKIDSLGGNSPPEHSDDNYPAKVPAIGVQHGMIVRGIARRNFKAKYFISPLFDLTFAKASMKDGLLEVVVPRKSEVELVNINIKEI